MKNIVMDLVHLRFPTLPAEYQIAIDVEQRLLSLLYLPAGRSANQARIVHHLKFSEGGIRAIAVLLKYPTFCPFDYLLASQQLPMHILHSFILNPSSSLLPEMKDLVQDCAKRIDEAKAGEAREKILAPLRRAINEIIPQLQMVNLFIFNLRGEGYCMHYVVFPPDPTYSRTKRSARTSLRNEKKGTKT